jgi:hypothetical protein
MKSPARTPAELQIEALRQLKQSQARRPAAAKAPKPAAPVPSSSAPGMPNSRKAGFELSEQATPTPIKSLGPTLPLSPEIWRRLRERQREHREFKRRRDMGDWAAELLLALPPGSAALNQEARAELLARMREWAEARGLR